MPRLYPIRFAIATPYPLDNIAALCYTNRVKAHTLRLTDPADAILRRRPHNSRGKWVSNLIETADDPTPGPTVTAQLAAHAAALDALQQQVAALQEQRHAD